MLTIKYRLQIFTNQFCINASHLFYRYVQFPCHLPPSQILLLLLLIVTTAISLWHVACLLPSFFRVTWNLARVGKNKSVQKIVQTQLKPQKFHCNFWAKWATAILECWGPTSSSGLRGPAQFHYTLQVRKHSGWHISGFFPIKSDEIKFKLYKCKWNLYLLYIIYLKFETIYLPERESYRNAS